MKQEKFVVLGQKDTNLVWVPKKVEKNSHGKSEKSQKELHQTNKKKRNGQLNAFLPNDQISRL